MTFDDVVRIVIWVTERNPENPKDVASARDLVARAYMNAPDVSEAVHEEAIAILRGGRAHP